MHWWCYGDVGEADAGAAGADDDHVVAGDDDDGCGDDRDDTDDAAGVVAAAAAAAAADDAVARVAADECTNRTNHLQSSINIDASQPYFICALGESGDVFLLT